MAIDPGLRGTLSLPVICAPMFMVTGPELVTEACKAGIVGGLPRQNARTLEEFETWLSAINEDLRRYSDENPAAPVGPVAVNLATRMSSDDLKKHLQICGRYNVGIIISAAGDPTELIKQVHDWGGQVFHDVTSMRFAEKAIQAGADGLTCITSGGGGHSGRLSPLTFIPKVRSIFDGTIIMAGCVSNGSAIRAAEVLGADLAYMGTRFIATRESRIPEVYRELLVSETSSDLLFTDKVAGVGANWLVRSLEAVGLDPQNLPQPRSRGMSRDHLPEHAKPWVNIWSAGQGIDLIDDTPTVAELVGRLKAEYRKACELPPFYQ